MIAEGNWQVKFSDFYKWNQDKEVNEEIVSHFTKGIFFIFDTYQTLNANSKLTILNLIDVMKITDQNFKKAHLFLLINYLNTLMYANRNKEFLTILMDEAHLIFNDELSLYTISKMTREARKFNTMFLLGSQNISDFYSINNEILSSIFSNTANIFIGKIESDQINIINDMLSTKFEKLQKEEIEHLQLNRGSFLYITEKERHKINISFNETISKVILLDEQKQDQIEY